MIETERIDRMSDQEIEAAARRLDRLDLTEEARALRLQLLARSRVQERKQTEQRT
jgi:hypothetical protein